MIRHPSVILALVGFAAAAVAADVPPPRPRQAPPVSAAADPDVAGVEQHSAAPGAPKFVAEDKWILAGYNNNEIVYQVFVTSHDTRIIRCTTDIKGFYLDNGKKVSIDDRQITTVFPNQLTQVGNWVDLDQPSGATYSVKCHPV
jgi:hypothetical protein